MALMTSYIPKGGNCTFLGCTTQCTCSVPVSGHMHWNRDFQCCFNGVSSSMKVAFCHTKHHKCAVLYMHTYSACVTCQFHCMYNFHVYCTICTTYMYANVLKLEQVIRVKTCGAPAPTLNILSCLKEPSLIKDNV